MRIDEDGDSQDENEQSTMRLIMKTTQGSVWHVVTGGYFWIRFGMVRWQIDEDSLPPYRNFLQKTMEFLSGPGNGCGPAFLRTKDPAISLAFNSEQLRELVYLLDASESIFTIESAKV
ncbi:MAG: hypothetical protein M3Y08_21055 [Fibrobacterota bacterium]|nr:hypothetical protein [Fibrobacterota bacterium]